MGVHALHITTTQRTLAVLELERICYDRIHIRIRIKVVASRGQIRVGFDASDGASFLTHLIQFTLGRAVLQHTNRAPFRVLQQRLWGCRSRG